MSFFEHYTAANSWITPSCSIT